MRGFPPVVSTKQDYLNLLIDPDFHAQALADLTDLKNFNDSKVTVAITTGDDPMNDENTQTEEIDNPNPLWKQKGFTSWQDVADTVEAYQ